MDITTATPAQIDGFLAETYSKIARLMAEVDNATQTVERINGVQDTYEAAYAWNSLDKRDAALATISKNRDEVAALREAAQPAEARYDAERWSRYYLVTNAGGHVHFTTACDTCFDTTKFAWLTDYSGMTHEALVEEAGTVACTRCFPDAPVDVLRRASRIKYESGEAKARREEREAKAAAKAAAEVTVENWIDYGRVTTKVFKTERAVTNAIASALSSLMCWGTEHPTSQEWLSQITAARTALAAKGVEYDYDKALAAARKRYEREARKYDSSAVAAF